MSGKFSDNSKAPGMVNFQPDGNAASHEEYDVDMNELRDLVGDNRDQHCLLLQTYTESVAVGIRDIKTACKNQDAEPIRRQSCKLKSSSRSIGADKLACIFQSLETAGKAMRWHEIEILVSRIEYHFRKVEACIENFCPGSN